MLRVNDLMVHFPLGGGRVVRAVDGVSFTVDKGETLGLVGESGCGKSVTGYSLMRLVLPPGRTVAGEVRLDGEDLLTLPLAEMRKRRGEQISMIFQEPMTSLDPLYPVRDPLGEAVGRTLRRSRRARMPPAQGQGSAVAPTLSSSVERPVACPQARALSTVLPGLRPPSSRPQPARSPRRDPPAHSVRGARLRVSPSPANQHHHRCPSS